MRLELLTLCVVGFSAFAQPRSGSYGGYISGWAYDSERPSFYVGNYNLAPTYVPRPQPVNPYPMARSVGGALPEPGSWIDPTQDLFMVGMVQHQNINTSRAIHALARSLVYQAVMSLSTSGIPLE